MYELFQTYNSHYWWIVPVFCAVAFNLICLLVYAARMCCEFVLEEGQKEISVFRWLMPKVLGDNFNGFFGNGDIKIKEHTGLFLCNTYHEGFRYVDKSDAWVTFSLWQPSLLLLVLLVHHFFTTLLYLLGSVAVVLYLARACARSIKGIKQKLESHINDKEAHK